VKQCDCAPYTALVEPRQLYRQTRNLLGEAVDAVQEYLDSLAATSAARLRTVERLSMFSIGLLGQEEVLKSTLMWTRQEDKATLEAIDGPEGIRAKLDRALASLTRVWVLVMLVGGGVPYAERLSGSIQVQDSLDTRLHYIDECAAYLARERCAFRFCFSLFWFCCFASSHAHASGCREEWKKEVKSASFKRLSTSIDSSVLSLHAKNEDMVGCLEALELSVGGMAADLQIWVEQASFDSCTS
jgi:hypothetical protein